MKPIRDIAKRCHMERVARNSPQCAYRIAGGFLQCTASLTLDKAPPQLTLSVVA